jgi:hypothetical protein
MTYNPHGTFADVSAYPSIQHCGRRYDIVSDTGVEPVQLRIPNPAAYHQALSEIAITQLSCVVFDEVTSAADTIIAPGFEMNGFHIHFCYFEYAVDREEGTIELNAGLSDNPISNFETVMKLPQCIVIRCVRYLDSKHPVIHSIFLVTLF